MYVVQCVTDSIVQMNIALTNIALIKIFQKKKNNSLFFKSRDKFSALNRNGEEPVHHFGLYIVFHSVNLG